MSGEIRKRPGVMSMGDNFARLTVVRELIGWALHIEARLAKYETFAPSPKAGETVVTKHTAFDPDRRPGLMTEARHQIGLDVNGIGRSGLRRMLFESCEWSAHLEDVREGLQAQLNQYERQERQRLESELANNGAPEDD